jgi:hypothetical protein
MNRDGCSWGLTTVHASFELDFVIPLVGRQDGGVPDLVCYFLIVRAARSD